jgi:phosphatidylinositol alpha-1,6-mannosyltransferase
VSTPGPAVLPRTLVLGGHFPPETGGVQTFVWELVQRLPADRVVVVAPAWTGGRAFDATLDFPVIRRRGYLLFRDLRSLVAQHRLQVGWITAMAPFGLYAPWLRHAGLERIVASTHGQELGWIKAWPTRVALSRVAGAVDTVTYLSEATRVRLAPVVDDRTPLVELAGGVDTDRFQPQVSGRWVRDRYALGGDPVVVSVGRLVRRKGYDVLLAAWPAIRSAVPGARLLIVGDGPMLTELRARAAASDGSVVVTGPVPADELPAHYRAADAFVLACRDDRGGLQTEGLGLSVIEASASGLPVVVGRSGGSARSLIDGVTGTLIDASRTDEVATALIDLLADGGRRHRLGAAGRHWAVQNWSWDSAAQRLIGLLARDVVTAGASDG